MRRFSCALLLALASAGSVSAAIAQSASDPTTSVPGKSSNGKPARKKTAAAKPTNHKPDPYQSPLATIMSSHLRADVPEAQDFVRESRPAANDLKYTPLQSQLGPDPVRPKPRDPANVMALQAELEASITHNAARGGVGKAKARRAKPSASAD